MQKRKQQTKLSPIITMIIIILFVSFLSLILSIIKFDGIQTTIENGILENSIIVVKNIFSKEGIIYLFNNVLQNFNIIQPFILVLLSLLATGIAKNSGLIKHLSKGLKKYKLFVIIFLTVFLGIISNFIGNYCYIILIPFIAVYYEYLNKSPLLGIISLFLGITLGYGTGLIFNYNDYALGMLTQASAIIDVDSSYKFNLMSNYYIMLTSTIFITFLITFLINRYIVPKIKHECSEDDELIISKKALICSIITLGLIVILIGILILPNGILLDNTQEVYIAKLFGPNSPFYRSFMLIFLFTIIIVSIVYGIISKNFKNNQEICWGLTKEINNIGYLFCLMFLSSILISIVDWTNIGVTIANKLVSIIGLFDFTGIVLITVSYIFIILMSIFIPNNIQKWSLISPILVPIFMRGNLSPDFAQFVFKAADSVGKSITPLFIYFIMMIGFIQKFNKNKSNLNLFDLYKLIFPVIITLIVFWLLLLIIWYIAGLPLGINTLVTM